MNSRTFTEIKIPVEYGHLAAKDWGPATGKPILAIHGWQDNAGTFDTLVSWLDPNLRVVALDLPGHGLSSCRPPGASYHYMDYLLDMKKAVEYLKWTTFTVMGHSMGGGLGMMYASVFPDNVPTVISLDLIKPVTCPPSDLLRFTAVAIKDHYLHCKISNKEPQVFNYDDALERLLKSTAGSLTKASAIVMLKRGLQPSENGKGVVYTRDVRLQSESLQRLDDHTCRSYISGMKCNLLLVRAKNGYTSETPTTIQNYQDMYKRNCQKYVYAEIDGTHHCHLNNPAVLAPTINSFLSSLP